MSKTVKTKPKLPPSETAPLIRRLIMENAREHLRKYALAFVFMGLVAASTAASAWIMKDVINEVFINKDKAMIYAISAFVMLIFFVKGASGYGQQVILSRVGNAIVAKCQRQLFERILHQEFAFFQKMPLGEITTRIQHNTNAARSVIDMVVLTVGRDVLTLIGLVAVMIIQDPLLSLVALVIMPPAVIGVSLLVRRVRKHAKNQFVSTTRILSVLQETALGIRIVKAFGVEDRLQRAMNQAVADVERQANKIAALTARTSPLMETLGGCAVALVILYGGYSVVELGREPGAFFSFITSLLLAYDPAKRLARLQVNLNNALVGVKLMYELIDARPVLQEAADAGELAVGKGAVRFDAVEFSYGEGAALKGLSFEAQSGQTTALVGASGAGKSTVFSLLERFYDPSAGRIEIDGQDIRHVTLASLRKAIAYVSQDTFLFDLSVADNIRLGRPGATDAEVQQAAADANAHDFIAELPGGYDAPVGEGGGQLSGGQRQRIAIARAMLRNAPVLLLDEATSALDAESEAKVQTALERLMRGRTTLVIAHRLSTVRDADKIVVMDQGRCLEEGSHIDLIRQDGIYRRLHDLQFNKGTSHTG